MGRRWLRAGVIRANKVHNNNVRSNTVKFIVQLQNMFFPALLNFRWKSFGTVGIKIWSVCIPISFLLSVHFLPYYICQAAIAGSERKNFVIFFFFFLQARKSFKPDGLLVYFMITNLFLSRYRPGRFSFRNSTGWVSVMK